MVHAKESKKRSIVVSLPLHEILILEDGKEVRPRIREFSTGRSKHRTPLGEFWVSAKERYVHHSSTLYNDSSGHPAPMPFALFIEKVQGAGFETQHTKCAFHGGDPNTESHGCIHLAKEDARWLFHWAGGHNVHVTIHGPHPHNEGT